MFLPCFMHVLCMTRCIQVDDIRILMFFVHGIHTSTKNTFCMLIKFGPPSPPLASRKGSSAIVAEIAPLPDSTAIYASSCKSSNTTVAPCLFRSEVALARVSTATNTSSDKGSSCVAPSLFPILFRLASSLFVYRAENSLLPLSQTLFTAGRGTTRPSTPPASWALLGPQYN